MPLVEDSEKLHHEKWGFSMVEPQVTLDTLSAGTHTVRVYAQEGVVAIDAFSVEASK